MEKAWELVKKHPWLFGSLAAIIVVYFLWPSSSSSSSTSGNGDAAIEGNIAAAQAASDNLQAASIASQTQLGLGVQQVQLGTLYYNDATNVSLTGLADSLYADSINTNAQLETNLHIGDDQVTIAGLGDATQQAINGQNTAAAENQAAQAASAAEAQSAAQLAISNNAASTAKSLADDVLTSQNSAQSFIKGLESAGLNPPSSLTTEGYSGLQTNASKTATAAATTPATVAAAQSATTPATSTTTTASTTPAASTTTAASNVYLNGTPGNYQSYYDTGAAGGVPIYPGLLIGNASGVYAP